MTAHHIMQLDLLQILSHTADQIFDIISRSIANRVYPVPDSAVEKTKQVCKSSRHSSLK